MMSHSAPQSKLPSPARSPRHSQEEQERPHKPAGIINMGMTCFLNSTFQALCATPALISLLRHNPAVPLHLAPNSILPPSPVPPNTVPALLPATLEPPLYELLQVTRAFTNSLHKAWTMKDLGGGTAGAMEASSRHSFTLRQLLKEMARKYDQYDEFAQQDAHELLRHLLDSMQMEEKDVMKRIVQQRRGSGLPPDAGLSPFVDVLFGGLLSSVVVCETCKSVSHTYEGFLDISLSMRGDEDAPKTRKRDKLRSWLKPLGNGKDATMSEPEGSDSERHKSHGHGHGRKKHTLGHGRPSRPTSDAESDGASLGRSASAKLGKAVRPSFSFGRKGKNHKDRGKHGDKESGSSAESPSVSGTSPPLPGSGPPTPRPGSPVSTTSVPEQIAEHNVHAAAPTPAQTAYIQRILFGPPAPPEKIDPLAKLRAAHAGDLNAGNAQPPDYGLIDCLKAFMSVEVLEGDNAFACHKCWRIKNGHYKKPKAASAPATVSPTTVSSGILPPAPEVPSIAVEDSDAPNGIERQGRYTTYTAHRGLVRTPSPLRQMVERQPSISFSPNEPYLDRTMTANSSVQSSVFSLNTTETNNSTAPTRSTSSDSTGSTSTASLVPRGESDSDGLSEPSSDSDVDDDALPGAGKRPAFFRPALTRAQSRNKHYILRRAFKRYLVAKAPEVLVFHIKRFKQMGGGGVYVNFTSLKKLEDFVSFPEELDMAPFMAPNRNDFKVVNTPCGPRAPYQDWPSPEQCPEPAPMPYRLYAVVVHMGTMVTGHYIAYVLVDPERMFATGEDVSAGHLAQLAIDPKPKPTKDRRVWCYCSDTEIRAASLKEVLAAKAYLCFYEKV